MNAVTLALRYAAFAVIATLANLGSQRLVLLAGGNPAPGTAQGTGWFMVALLVGTAVGLVIKYALDKRWIFADFETGLSAHGRKFSLYTAMGLVTTAIFWGSEAAAWLIWQTDLAREAGAVFGLAIGYLVKYQLDKRFVFRPATYAAGVA